MSCVVVASPPMHVNVDHFASCVCDAGVNNLYVINWRTLLLSLPSIILLCCFQNGKSDEFMKRRPIVVTGYCVFSIRFNICIKDGKNSERAR